MPVGIILSGNKSAYHYLGDSMRKYYSSSEVRDLLTQAGFREVKYRPLFFGAAGIHVAIK